MSIYYTQTHEWVQVKDNIATIGVTSFALEQLGDLVYIELPEVGSDISKGGESAVVESVKAASDVYAAVSGTIREVNEELADDASIASADSPMDCWLYRVEMSTPSEIDDLLDEASYNETLDH